MIIILAANEKCCDRISEDYEEPTPRGPASYDDHADHFFFITIIMIYLRGLLYLHQVSALTLLKEDSYHKKSE